jgi:hypothetical protein
MQLVGAYVPPLTIILFNFPDIHLGFTLTHVLCVQTMAPAYASASVQLAEAFPAPAVVLAKVDATVETDLAEKYGIQGFPTLKWFKKGQEFEYDGARDMCGPPILLCTWCRRPS